MGMFDSEYSEQELQKLLKKVREMLRDQGLSEEEIAEGVAELRDRLPHHHKMMTEFWETYRHDFAECMARLIARQESHFPDFDELYRRKAELDRRAENTPLPPTN